MTVFILMVLKIQFDNEQGECSALNSFRLELWGDSPIDYEKIEKIAEPRDQIRAIIGQAAQWNCLPSGHWFRISIDPHHPGVVINPKTLSSHQQNDDTINIYIQHQFLDLRAMPNGISVIVYFQEIPDRLFIPYDAITFFDDPGHNYEVEIANEPVLSNDGI